MPEYDIDETYRRETRVGIQITCQCGYGEQLPLKWALAGPGLRVQLLTVAGPLVKGPKGNPVRTFEFRSRRGPRAGDWETVSTGPR